MYQIIASTLFQHKICRLPGIGTLVMVAHAAKADFINSTIQAPTETIEFRPGELADSVFNEFSAMSELLQKKLDESGSVFLKGIGNFTRDQSGKIGFDAVPIDPVFTQPVPAERVIRQDATHAILVGDQQTTNVEMTGFYNETPVKKDRWWVWAIVLATIGIAVLVIYFMQHGFKSLGNTLHF